MGLRIGIVGLPNVGKSTLFNALTKMSVPAANYPFCTIEPNRGVVPVPDRRLSEIAAITKPEILTGATIEFVDIAGLVAGASKGEGLGNQFLSHIREVDAILHVVRLFESDDVSSATGRIDPIDDAEVVQLELLLADLQTVENRIDKTQRLLKTGEQRYKEELVLLEKAWELLNKGTPLRNVELSLPEDLRLLTQKPILYGANLGEVDYPEMTETSTARLNLLKQKVALEGSSVISFAASLEAELAVFDSEEAELFLEDFGLTEPALHQVIHKSMEILNLITFYTVKGPQTRAWIIPAGTNAPRAAGKIHSDMEKGFIRAEVTQWEQLLGEGSFANCREKGLIRSEGRDYKVADGDVILFRFNV